MAEGSGHPQHQQLSRFLRGDATGEERRAITRHLLKGCSLCSSSLQTLYRGPASPEIYDEALGRAIQRAARGSRVEDPRPRLGWS